MAKVIGPILVMSSRAESFQQSGVEKDPQLRSRIAQTLHVPQRVRVGPSLAAALLEGLFEHPTGCLLSHPELFCSLSHDTVHPMGYTDEITITRILKDCPIIAVVGLSSNPARPSYGVAAYMRSQGYRVIPVNPNETNVLGEPAYPSLVAVPGPIDLVSIFRKSEDVLPVVEGAIARGAKAIWMQEGVINEQAAGRAREAGLLVVMDRCWLKEHTARANRG